MSDLLDEQITKQSYSYKFKPVIVIALCIATAVLIFLRFKHIPGGLLFSMLSLSFLTSYSIFSFIILKGKDLLNLLFTILTVLWFLFIFWGAIFNEGHPFNFIGISFFIGFNLVALLVQFITLKIKRSRFKKKFSD